MYDFLESIGVIILFLIFIDWEGFVDFLHNGLGESPPTISMLQTPEESMNDGFGEWITKTVNKMLDEVKK